MHEFPPRLFSLTLVAVIMLSIVNPAAGQRFVTPPHYPVGLVPIGIATADFNGDGKPDVVVADEFSHSISVLLNDGHGTLQAAVNYTVGEDNSPSAVVVGDFNGDGKTDIAAAGDWCCGGQLMVFLGNGDGTFQAGVPYGTGGDTPHSISAADLNGDGKLDLIVNNESEINGGLDAIISVLLGNGDGTFQAATTTVLTNLESTVGSMVVGDFNKDSKIDVAVLDRATLAILLGNGNGTFQTPIFYTEDLASSLAAGDMNGDGILDLVTGNEDGSASVLLGNGNGTFQAALTTAGQVYDFAITLADLNGDGKLDVITAGTNSVDVFLGDGKGGLSSPVVYASAPSAAESGSVATADLNGDGHLDIICSNYRDSSITTIFGNGDGTLQALTVSHNYAGPMLTGDFNGDGKLDIVTSLTTNQFSLFLGNGDGTLREPVSFAVGNEPLSITVADFNGDGKLDVATANYSTISVVFGNGDGTFQPAIEYGKSSNLGSPSTYITAADVNGDGKPDLAVITRPGGGSTVVAILLNNGKGKFLPAVQYKIDDIPVEVTFADFNGDGILDMATMDSRSPYPVSVLLGNGDGTFQSAVDYPTGIGSGTGILAADVNNDGKPDILVMWGVLGALLGNGDGTFQPVIYNTEGGGIDITAHDFNGDGNLDIAATARNYSADFGVYYGNGDGTFNFIPYGLGAEYHAAGDFNGDNALDVAIYNGVGIVILQNTGGTADVLTSSVNPSKLHQSVTFKAAVSATVKGSPGGTPTGTVTFRNGAAKLGTVALRNGMAFFATSALSAGTHKITAAYSGDINFNPNVSAPLSQTVHP